MTTHYGHFTPYELDNTPNPLTGDAWGGYYCRHVSALTEENLHAKSEIAAELGWRDLQIDRLRAELKYQTDNSSNLQASIDGLHGRIRELEAEIAEERKPDCRFCCYRFPIKNTCALEEETGNNACVGGSRHNPFGAAVLASPIRLYEKEGKV